MYEEAGVLEYWIINPETKDLLQYKLTDGRFQALRPLTIGDVIATQILPGFTLSLDEIFKDE